MTYMKHTGNNTLRQVIINGKVETFTQEYLQQKGFNSSKLHDRHRDVASAQDF